ncbi:MAG: hypothetical protein HQ506_03035 [Candidatus Marinimicrobia bacterium]|nr:hypothetical protein [Candidatus Neomarinimicrobiota bacterium]
MDKRTHVLALLVLIILVGSVFGQDNTNTTQIFHWAAGHCENVAVNDNYVYFNDDSAVVIAAISDPSSPEEVGRIMIPGGSIQKIVYSNSHLCGVRPIRFI